MRVDKLPVPDPSAMPMVRRWAPLSGATPRQIVFVCHGYGGGPNQLGLLVREWQNSARHALFVAPRAPEARTPRLRERWFGRPREGLGSQWFALGRAAPATPEQGVAAAARWLNAFMDAEIAAQAMEQAPYALAGFSQGAMVALYAGLRRARAPACIVCHATQLLAPERLAAELRARPPVTLVVAEQDEIIAPHLGFAAETALRAHGIPVTTHLLPGLRHNALKGGEEHGRAAVAWLGSDALARAFAS